MDDKETFSGPVTLEEIKWVLGSERAPAVIDRRATISNSNPSRTVYADSPTENFLIKERFFGNDEDNLSESFISEYLTPSNTSENVHKASVQELKSYTCSTPNRSFVDINNDKENFIEQMSKVLNLSSCQSSVYASAGECSNANIHKHTDVRKFSPAEGSTDVGGNQCLNQISDTILVSSDDDDDYNENHCKASNISNNEGLPEATNKSFEKFSTPQIFIISDSDSSFEEQIFIKAENDGPRETFSEVFNPELQTSKALVSETCVDDPGNCATTSPTNYNVACDRSEISAAFEQIENRSSTSSDYSFNDTLAEMELALKHGLDYTMPDETTDNFKPKTSLPELHELLNRSSNSKGDSSKAGISTNKLNSSSDKFSKTLIPVKSSQTRVVPPKSVSPIKPSFTKPDFNFKVPSKPATIRKTPDYTSVLSPVAVYIKNSPKVPQVQHVLSKPGVVGSLFPKLSAGSVSNKENEELPTRLYKPAKHAIVSKEKDLKLPGSVQKYIHTPGIIKHVARITKDQTNTISVEEKLLNEDLTMCDGDVSFSSSSLSQQDISLHTTKKAYIK